MLENVYFHVLIFSKTGKGNNNINFNWPNIGSLDEPAVGIIMDKTYLEKLQGKLQKESVSSIKDRLAERMVLQ